VKANRILTFLRGKGLVPFFLPLSSTLGTRKKVIYSCTEGSQEKSWWTFVAILTCKSFVRCGYSGERPIELSSSWFPPNFPSG